MSLFEKAGVFWLSTGRIINDRYRDHFNFKDSFLDSFQDTLKDFLKDACTRICMIRIIDASNDRISWVHSKYFETYGASIVLNQDVAQKFEVIRFNGKKL